MQELHTTGDGSSTLKSTQFDALYHSKHGAIQESQVVFLQAGLYHQMERFEPLSVLGIGFGTGLNALLTYLAAAERQYPIAYTAVEAYPIGMDLVAQLNYIDQLNASAADQQAFEQMHQATGPALALSPYFSFEKKVASFESIEAQSAYDVVYYDAFAPAVQPELWDLPAFERMHRAMCPNGVLTTYCAKGSVKRALKAAGFDLEALPGPIGKREITRAIKPH